MSNTTRRADRAAELDIDEVRAGLRDLRDRVLRAVLDSGSVDPDDPSIANMRAYLTLREQDNRALQDALARLGLSSLGRSEGHVLATLEQVLGVVEGLGPDAGSAAAAFDEADAILRRRVQSLFGPTRGARGTRIMVTLPSEAATDPRLVRSLVAAGMDCARINSAHDDEAAWTQMAAHVREAATAEHRRVPILVDLPGPKLRTGDLAPGPEVVRLRPRHDDLGAVVEPARAWLCPDGAGPAPPDAPVTLPVDAAWLAALSEGESVRFTDARGRRLTLDTGPGSPEGRWVTCRRGAYVVTGTSLTAASGRATRVGRLPARRSHIPLGVGDTLVLTRDQTPGRAATATSPARIPCTLPAAFAAVGVGHSVWLDDAKFGGIVRRATPDEVEVEVTHAPAGGGKLRAEKGINLPDTLFPPLASSADDDARIAFAVAHADMVGLSFVSSRDDVRAVGDALARRGGEDIAMILKIETRAGFHALPDLLGEALSRRAPCGVMIARGDLAIEVGWERMAEVQEEILWLCEAAHVPVIWATQVLDTLARTGLASRAEITDAAYGARADCVMLNKGPMIAAAITALEDILGRMAGHRRKKTTLLRPLRAWSDEPA
jgi:pyruvate kinase